MISTLGIFSTPIWTTRPPRSDISHVIGSFCNVTDVQSTNHHVPHVSIDEEYILTEEETLQCMRMGAERNQKNVEKKTQNRNFSSRDDEDISIQGVVGELAFARLFKLPIEIFDTTCRNAMNDTFDATLPFGKRCDVKCTYISNAPIIVSTWKRTNPPELYALVIMDNYADRRKINIDRLPKIRFKGFVRSCDIFQDCNLRTMKNGYQHYHWEQSKLLCYPDVLEKNPNG